MVELAKAHTSRNHDSCKCNNVPRDLEQESVLPLRWENLRLRQGSATRYNLDPTKDSHPPNTTHERESEQAPLEGGEPKLTDTTGTGLDRVSGPRRSTGPRVASPVPPLADPAGKRTSSP